MARRVKKGTEKHSLKPVTVPIKVQAKAVIEGKAKCVEEGTFDIAGAKVWSTGYVEYFVGNPWYEPGEFIQSEDW